VLAGLGVAGPGLAPTSAAVRAAPAAPKALPFRATLRATTHRPRATRLWHCTIRVVDLQGRPIQARARFQIAFAGPSAPPPRRLGGLHTFRGSYTAAYRWPRATRGEPLVFQAIVTAKGATKRLGYWIRVR
jgi:hypothetical protein